MSELQLSLLALGAIGIVAVVLFNRWQEQKYRKQAEKMFSGGRQDVLFDEPARTTAEDPARRPATERIEPSMGPAPVVADSDPGPVPSSAVAASHTPVERSPAPAPVPLRTPRVEMPVSASTVDETIDLVGVIHPGAPISVDAVNGLMARAHTFSKPVRWEGLEAGRWSPIAAVGQYTELRLGLQLADRRGPVASADISRFIALAKQFAVELGGTGQTEAEDSAGERATELDGFCADVDVEIGVNLITKDDHGMPATKIRALAEAAGMKLDGEGVFHLEDERGAPLFTLRNSEPRPFIADHVRNISTHGITLILDVPRVGHGVQAFDQMLRLGRHIANSLGGEVVDDNRRPLTDAGADSIRRQLGLIYRQMDGFGIPAGSPLALRLFS